VSMEEWQVFRHFWSPTYVSKMGPSKTPEDGRPIAEGPLGGFFIDKSFLEIWQTNMINMMLEYYLDNRAKVCTSAQSIPCTPLHLNVCIIVMMNLHFFALA